MNTYTIELTKKRANKIKFYWFPLSSIWKIVRLLLPFGLSRLIFKIDDSLYSNGPIKFLYFINFKILYKTKWFEEYSVICNNIKTEFTGHTKAYALHKFVYNFADQNPERIPWMLGIDALNCFLKNKLTNKHFFTDRDLEDFFNTNNRNVLDETMLKLEHSSEYYG